MTPRVQNRSKNDPQGAENDPNNTKNDSKSASENEFTMDSWNEPNNGPADCAKHFEKCYFLLQKVPMNEHSNILYVLSAPLSLAS